jgi:hypothetical protein
VEQENFVEREAALYAIPGSGPDRVEFIASIDTGSSAITFSGEAPSSARLKLEIPGTQRDRVMRLIAMTGLPLKVTIEPDV